MKERDRLHQRFLYTRDIIDWDNFKSCRNNVKRALKKAENEYNSNEVQQHKDNPGSLWKIVSRLIRIPSKSKERQIYKGDHKSLANDINQFFSSVGENAARASTHLEDTNNINLRESIETVIILENDQFKFRAITCHEVRRVVLSLLLNKSSGPDKINPRIIKDCLPVILGPLTEIINCSLRTSTFPLAWKKQNLFQFIKKVITRYPQIIDQFPFLSSR
jgi:signal recognition particle subunit SEC65